MKQRQTTPKNSNLLSGFYDITTPFRTRSIKLDLLLHLFYSNLSRSFHRRTYLRTAGLVRNYSTDFVGNSLKLITRVGVHFGIASFSSFIRLRRPPLSPTSISYIHQSFILRLSPSLQRRPSQWKIL